MRDKDERRVARDPREAMRSSGDSGSRFFDVSHTVEHGMITYKGLPAPIICDYMSREQSRQHYSEGTEFHRGLENVPHQGLKFFAVPVKVRGLGSFPVRAFAVIEI
jgi:kynurenine formamidase